MSRVVRFSSSSRRVPEPSAGRGVRVEDMAVQVVDEDGVLDPLEQGAGPPLGGHQGGLGLLAPGDVLDRAPDADDLPLGIAYQAVLDGEVDGPAVPGAVGPLHRHDRPFTVNALIDRMPRLIAHRLVDELEDRPADHLVPGVSEHLALGAVDVDDPPLGVDGVIADRRLVVQTDGTVPRWRGGCPRPASVRRCR